MKKINLVVIFTFLLSVSECVGQSPVFVPNQPGYELIKDYAIDSITNKIYYVLNYLEPNPNASWKRNLIVMDAISGVKLFTGPDLILPIDVSAIEYTNGALFIGGTTDNVSSDGFIYQLNPITGVIVSSWKHDLGAIYNLNCMASDQSNLYVGGYFDNAIGTIIIDIVTGRNQPVATSDFNSIYSKKIYVGSSAIYLMSADGLKIYSPIDFSLERSIYTTTFGEPSDFTISEYDQSAYVAGKFANDVGGLKFDCNTGLQDKSWSFKYFGNCCSTTDSGYVVSDIISHPTEIIIGGNIQRCNPCSNDKILQTYYGDSTLFDFTGVSTPAFPFNNHDNGNFKTLNNRLFIVSAMKRYFSSDRLAYWKDTIVSFCLRPSGPKKFTISKPVICTGEQNVIYEVEKQYGITAYQWYYTGKGATIKGSGNRVTINFSDNATDGILGVTAISECQQKSTALQMEVACKPSPNANAGEDAKLTCSTTSLQLKGSSTTTPVFYSWTYPDATTNNMQSITAFIPGRYQLKVTNSNSGCISTDELFITLDTAHSIVTCPLSYTITGCNPDYITVNGTSDNAGDLFKWIGSSIPTTNPANLYENDYLLEVRRVANGCKTTAIVNVKSVAIYPKVYFPSNVDTSSAGICILDTLTCSQTTAFLNFGKSTASSKITIKRPPPLNDTVPNNIYTSIPGVYKVYIKDTISHCTGKSILFEIKINKTIPQLSLVTKAPVINCSVPTVILYGSSKTPNGILNWTGSSGFSSTNPATVSGVGSYTLTVIDPENGCRKTDSVMVIKKNTLAINGNSDTLICKDNQVQLNVSAIGGTPPFSYSWNNNAGTTQTVFEKPSETTMYIATVIDGANCKGQDTVIVKIPSPINDSTVVFASCDPLAVNGEIQIFATGGIPPYHYSKDNGVTYQNQSVFSKLPFGTYELQIKDSLNCTHIFSKTITAQSQQPVADFIVNTTMMAKDTFVVVDISNPRPDTVIWNFPASVEVINYNPFAPVIVSVDTGEVSITMEAHFGSCIVHFTKKVRCIKTDSLKTSTNGNGIKEIKMYPNPNNGEFSVEIKLFKKQTIGLYIYNAQGIEQTRIAIPPTDYSINNIVLPVPTPGTYLLKVIAEHDSKSKVFTIVQ